MLHHSIKYLIVTLFFVFATAAFAKQQPALPDSIKTTISQHYSTKAIKIISVIKSGSGLLIIVKTPSGRDKVVVDQKGNIISIAEYLEDVEPSGGC